jgi:hypothetical protein
VQADIRDFGEKAVNFFQNLLLKSVFANFSLCNCTWGLATAIARNSALCVKRFNLNIQSPLTLSGKKKLRFFIEPADAACDRITPV